MKPLLFVLLAGSLAGNVAWVVSLLHSSRATTKTTIAPAGPTIVTTAPTPGPRPDSPRSTSHPDNPLMATNAAGPRAWSGVRSDQDLQQVVSNLRAAGYPATLVRAVVNQLLNERFAPRQPNAGQPFWKRMMPAAETAAAQAALSHEREALFEALLGPDSRPAALLDADARERRYGALDDDKINAIARIERDYNEMSAEAWAKRRSNIVTDTSLQSQRLMEKEKFSDLAAVLTPDELAQYEMRNSDAARRLINNLRNVEVTLAEYTQIYEAQKAFSDAHPPRAMLSGPDFVQMQTDQLALNDQVRGMLGETRFYAYAEGADAHYAMVSRSLDSFPSVTPAATYQVYQLGVEVQRAIAQFGRATPASPEKTAEMQAAMEVYNSRLDDILGAATAEAYRKQGMGQLFSSFRTPPKPATGATK